MDFDGTTREWNDTELDEIQGYAMSQQMLDKKWWSASDAIGALRIREVKLRARIVELEEQVRMRDEVATALEKERNVYKDFINGYGSFPCHPDCDTISHSDQCPRVDIPLAFKTLQEENKRLREAGEELRAIVHQEAEYIDVDNLTTQTKYARYRNAVSSWLKEGK